MTLEEFGRERAKLESEGYEWTYPRGGHDAVFQLKKEHYEKGKPILVWIQIDRVNFFTNKEERMDTLRETIQKLRETNSQLLKENAELKKKIIKLEKSDTPDPISNLMHERTELISKLVELDKSSDENNDEEINATLKDLAKNRIQMENLNEERS